MNLTPFLFLLLILTFSLAFAQEDDIQRERIDYLEDRLKNLIDDVKSLKEELAHERASAKTKFDSAIEERLAILEEVEGIKKSGLLSLAPEAAWFQKMTLGGYGETHLNAREGKGNKFVDIHRFVFYMGYEFADWIKLESETELEHGFVNDGDGEISIEQLYLDFKFSEFLNVRVGRVLTPVGIINQHHEPTTFYSVERPAVENRIIPSTWSTDAVGIYGNIGTYLRYEAYVGSSLDGSGFSSTSGIRGGRIKERPGISEPGYTGRVDFFPLAGLDIDSHGLRLGLSMFAGGMNNGNRGRNPDINGEVFLYSADLQYRFSKFEFRALGAYGKIGASRELNEQFGGNVASDIAGFYFEAAYHFLPDSWKVDKFEESDAVFFVRYEDYNTQYKVHSGLAKDPAGNRNEWVFGLAFYPVPNLVLKVDYQLIDDASRESDLNQLNFGIGWDF